jgi:hypothetical protein
MGIAVAVVIIINDEYEIKSMDRIQSTFPAGLSRNQWYKSNIEHEAAPGIE